LPVPSLLNGSGYFSPLEWLAASCLWPGCLVKACL